MTRLAMLPVAVAAIVATLLAQPAAITIVLTGQSMIRSDLRSTKPSAVTAMGFNLLALSGNHAFDLKDVGIRNTIREADHRKIAHAGTGDTLAAASGAAELRTTNGTIALIASASGLLAAGARAAENRPGVNELRVHAGDR